MSPEENHPNDSSTEVLAQFNFPRTAQSCNEIYNLCNFALSDVLFGLQKTLSSDHYVRQTIEGVLISE